VADDVDFAEEEDVDGPDLPALEEEDLALLVGGEVALPDEVLDNVEGKLLRQEAEHRLLQQVLHNR
jgi:hypothetical protein